MWLLLGTLDFCILFLFPLSLAPSVHMYAGQLQILCSSVPSIASHGFHQLKIQTMLKFPHLSFKSSAATAFHSLSPSELQVKQNRNLFLRQPIVKLGYGLCLVIGALPPEGAVPHQGGCGEKAKKDTIKFLTALNVAFSWWGICLVAVYLWFPEPLQNNFSLSLVILFLFAWGNKALELPSLPHCWCHSLNFEEESGM